MFPALRHGSRSKQSAPQPLSLATFNLITVVSRCCCAHFLPLQTAPQVHLLPSPPPSSLSPLCGATGGGLTARAARHNPPHPLTPSRSAAHLARVHGHMRRERATLPMEGVLRSAPGKSTHSQWSHAVASDRTPLVFAGGAVSPPSPSVLLKPVSPSASCVSHSCLSSLLRCVAHTSSLLMVLIFPSVGSFLKINILISINFRRRYAPPSPLYRVSIKTLLTPPSARTFPPPVPSPLHPLSTFCSPLSTRSAALPPSLSRALSLSISVPRAQRVLCLALPFSPGSGAAFPSVPDSK